MVRLNIFAKGNLDVRDSLHAYRGGGEVLWNGLNQALRDSGAAVTARVRHETWTRSDALLEASGSPPPELAARTLPLGPFPASSQFSRAVFEAPSDVVALSIQPEVNVPLARHKQGGWLFYPYGFAAWPAEDRAWFLAAFEPEPMLSVERSMSNLEVVVERIRSSGDRPILIYNLSSVTPGETLHNHLGLDDGVSTRIRRFNLALIELSRSLGVSIVDVDHIVAKAGADRVKIDAVHLTADGSRLVAEEVVRILQDWGVLPVPEASRSSSA